MIKVTIEYHPSVFDPSNRYDTDDGPVEFTLLMEAVCGEVFEEELDHVDVRVRQLTRLDESAYPVLITVDGDTSDMHGSEQSLADDFHAAVEDRCRMFPTGSTPLPNFGVWVRSQPGAISDPARMKGKA